MQIKFYKYHGAGNDFVILDNRDMAFTYNPGLIYKLCHRRYGIGSDGLILIQNHPEADFEMKYFNSDGWEATMCGNGGRCAVLFAHHAGIIGKTAKFQAVDGEHSATILNDGIRISIRDIDEIRHINGFLYINTGSPHIILFVNDIKAADVAAKGREIRYNKEISSGGVNVNFVQIIDKKSIYIRTYERGVENETMSCGTGSVAAAIATFIKAGIKEKTYEVDILAQGGILKVEFSTPTFNHFSNIFLSGPATHVFDGYFDPDNFIL